MQAVAAVWVSGIDWLRARCGQVPCVLTSVSIRTCLPQVIRTARNQLIQYPTTERCRGQASRSPISFSAQFFERQVTLSDGEGKCFRLE